MTTEEAWQVSGLYVGAVERTLEILGAAGSGKIVFGEALQRAIQELGLEPPSEEIEAALLSFVFKTISGQRIPGAPDA